MCTVTYLPARQGFTLTHNRDEAPSRSLHSIERQESKRDVTVLFPRDAQAGGTWIITGENGRTACLLNGAFVGHRRQPPYRKSRGLMILDFFNTPLPDDFFEHYELEGIEPFTLLFFERGRVAEFRWDGSQRFLKNLPANEVHFWCSSTLYPADMQVKREEVFRRWLDSFAGKKAPDPRALIDIHLSGSVGDPANDFVMTRDGRVMTVSITQVVLRKNFVRMHYVDLLEGKRDERLLSLKDR